jgi:hypothetical protein
MLRWHQRPLYDSIPIKDLLDKVPYYNIGILLMAHDGDFDPLIHFQGERDTFVTYHSMMEYSNFLRNENPKHHPISVDDNFIIVKPHFHVAAALIAGLTEISYAIVPEKGYPHGLDWIAKCPYKKKIAEYYSAIPVRFGLVEDTTEIKSVK